jgi:hypothetical protein
MLNINRIAQLARRRFESQQVCPAILSVLYQAYNPLPDIGSFINRAKTLFPRLNCGLASIYLQKLLNRGDIIQGHYASHRHTFLMLNHSLIVDITADQFGGPKVYVGPVKAPWGLRNLPGPKIKQVDTVK